MAKVSQKNRIIAYLSKRAGTFVKISTLANHVKASPSTIAARVCELRHYEGYDIETKIFEKKNQRAGTYRMF